MNDAINIHWSHRSKKKDISNNFITNKLPYSLRKTWIDHCLYYIFVTFDDLLQNNVILIIKVKQVRKNRIKTIKILQEISYLIVWVNQRYAEHFINISMQNRLVLQLLTVMNIYNWHIWQKTQRLLFYSTTKGEILEFIEINTYLDFFTQWI